MKKLKLSMIQSALYLAMVACVLHGILSGISGTESDALKISFIPLTTLFISCILKKKSAKQDSILLVIFMLIVVWVLIIAITYKGNGLPLHLFAFAGDLMLYYISISWNMPEKCMYIFLVMCEIGAIIFLSIYNTNSWLRIGMGMTIGGFNPQHIGIWAFIFACISLIFFDLLKNKLIKVIPLIMMINMFVIMFVSQTRAAWFAFIIVVVMWIFSFESLLKKAVTQWLIACIPLIVLIISGLLNQIINIDNQYVSLFNGRENIWRMSLLWSRDGMFFGLYNKYNEVYTHNIFVEHVLYYGYILALIFIFLTYKSIHYHVERISNQIGYDALICFVGIVFVASQENAVFSISCGGVFVFSCGFLILISCVYKTPVPHFSIVSKAMKFFSHKR